MKNLILSCAFLFAASFSFAGVENQTSTADEALACIPTTLSCGITGLGCGDTLGDIIDIALAADELLF